MGRAASSIFCFSPRPWSAEGRDLFIRAGSAVFLKKEPDQVKT
jgi:hypothetical protein